MKIYKKYTKNSDPSKNFAVDPETTRVVARNRNCAWKINQWECWTYDLDNNYRDRSKWSDITDLSEFDEAICVAPDQSELLEVVKSTYLALLSLPFQSWRIQNQKVYCALRDAIAKAENRSCCEVQDEYEQKVYAELYKKNPQADNIIPFDDDAYTTRMV